MRLLARTAESRNRGDTSYFKFRGGSITFASALNGSAEVTGADIRSSACPVGRLEPATIHQPEKENMVADLG